MGRAIIGVLRLRQFPEPSLIFFLSSDRKRDKGRQERAVDFDSTSVRSAGKTRFDRHKTRGLPTCLVVLPIALHAALRSSGFPIQAC